jgi:hypothetical protein
MSTSKLLVVLAFARAAMYLMEAFCFLLLAAVLITEGGGSVFHEDTSIVVMIARARASASA